jgi:hypothetical protein
VWIVGKPSLLLGYKRLRRALRESALECMADSRRIPSYVRFVSEQTSVWIRRHGGLTPRLIVLRGRELAAMYPRCR